MSATLSYGRATLSYMVTKPTSFRLSDDELARIDRLARLIYESYDERVTITRRVAIMAAVDEALDRTATVEALRADVAHLKAELRYMQGEDDDA